MVSRSYAIPMMLIIITALLSIHSLTYVYSLDESRHVTIVAVSQLSNGSYIGVSANLYVRVICPGSGHVYVETLPLSQIDLQASTRVAALVASSIANISFYTCDFYASIKSDSPIIGGPSASAATAVAFAAALLRLPLNESVVMTGMILPDGSIGPVGGIIYKLNAAASRGAKIFLVPYGQTRDIVYRVVTQRIGPSIITRVVTETVDLISYGAQLNIQVIPVANVFEALMIFSNGIYKTTPITTLSLSNRLSTIYAALNDVQREWLLNLSSEITRVLNESKAIENKTLSLIGGYTNVYIRNILYNIDSSINNLKSQAEALASAEKLYAASSLYFQVLTYAYQRLYILKAVIDTTFVSEEINKINNSIYEVINSIHRDYAGNSMDVARLSIAINALDRAYEALIYINKTLASQYIDTLTQYLALASARAYTAKLWSILLDRYHSFGPSISSEDLNRMSLYISMLSQNIYTYIVAFSSSMQVSGGALSEAMYRYSLLLKADNALDRLTLGVSSISHMYLALVSLFLQDYSSTIEALNRTINISLSLLTTSDTIPIDIPLYMEMIKAFEAYPQTQLVMLSRLSIMLSIYRFLKTELSKPEYPSTEVNKESNTITTYHEKETETTTITITVTVTQPSHTITITSLVSASNNYINIRNEILIAIIIILLLIAIVWILLKKIFSLYSMK